MIKTITADFTVVGGGMAGISAAVTAARFGLKVALIERSDVLGGNASSEHRVHYNGAANVNVTYYAREGGVSDEMKLFLFRYNPRYNFKEDFDLHDMALFSFVRQEKNITLFLGTAVYGVKTENGKVTEVYARKTRTEEEFCFISPLYADASGDGIVAYSAGALYRMGRESRYEYGEITAPEKADALTMGSTISFTVGKNDTPVPFLKPDFAYDYEKDGILKWTERPETGRKLPQKLDGVDGIWWLSVGGMDDTIRDADKIDFELKRLVYGFWDYVKNSGKYPNSENYYLKWIAPVASKRESRRFLGDYVLKQQDLVEQQDYYDAVATGGWSIDVHDPGGVYGNKYVSEFYPIHGLYNIPYRIMYSKNIENLFLCGRIVSVSHIALGSIRVMQTLATMAQVVGTAAYLCKKYDTLPRNISCPNKVKELQTLLVRNGQYIAGRKEDVGLATTAKISSSGFCKLENIHNTIVLPLSNEYCLAIPVKNGRLDSIDIFLRNEKETRKTIRARLYSTKKQDAYEIGELLGKCEASIEAKQSKFITFEFNQSGIDNKIALIVLEKCEDICVYASEDRVTGVPTFIYKNNCLSRFPYDELLKNRKPYTLCFRNVLPLQKVYAPENVINGIGRPYGLPNVWRADIGERPWIKMEFEKAIDFQELQILFNGQLENDHFSSVVETLVDCYEIEIETSTDGIKKILVNDNYQALNKHIGDFHQVKSILIKVKSTYKNPYAEIFAIKIF